MRGDPKAAVRQWPRWRARFVVSVMAPVLGVALVAAGCASGHPQSGARHHPSSPAAAARPVTKPQVLTTTSSTAAPTTTTTSTLAVPPKVAAAPPAAPPPTTTSVPLPPGCNWSNFSTTVATDQAAYPQGQTVHITLTFRNAGPRCTVYVTGYGCPEVDIDNAGGQPTWTSQPQPATGCAATFTPGNPTVLESTWSQSYPVDWTQVDCSTRTAGSVGTCAGPQVAAGQYQIIGRDTGGASQIPSSAPLVVTIS